MPKIHLLICVKLYWCQNEKDNFHFLCFPMAKIDFFIHWASQKIEKIENFCTATALEKSFLNFCIFTQKRGIGSKKVISGFLLPPNKVEAYLPAFFTHTFTLWQQHYYDFENFTSTVCCKSQHFWHILKSCFHQKQQLCCYYWKWLSWCNGHQSLFDYHH